LGGGLHFISYLFDRYQYITFISLLWQRYKIRYDIISILRLWYTIYDIISSKKWYVQCLSNALARFVSILSNFFHKTKQTQRRHPKSDLAKTRNLLRYQYYRLRPSRIFLEKFKLIFSLEFLEKLFSRNSSFVPTFFLILTTLISIYVLSLPTILPWSGRYSGQRVHTLCQKCWLPQLFNALLGLPRL
jgi:hypothetical protein